MKWGHPLSVISIFALILAGCSSEESPAISLNGTYIRGRFSNSYLTFEAPKDWNEKTAKDPSQFLVIIKGLETSTSNIIFLTLDKAHLRDEFGIQSPEVYQWSLTNHFKESNTRQLISEGKSIRIDNKTFYFSEFIVNENNLSLRQVCYTTGMGDYYLGIVTTEEPGNPSFEMLKILKSIKFKAPATNYNTALQINDVLDAEKSDSIKSSTDFKIEFISSNQFKIKSITYDTVGLEAQLIKTFIDKGKSSTIIGIDDPTMLAKDHFELVNQFHRTLLRAKDRISEEKFGEKYKTIGNQKDVDIVDEIVPSSILFVHQ